MSMEILPKTIEGELRREIQLLKDRMAQIDGKEVKASESSEISPSIGSQSFGSNNADDEGLSGSASEIGIGWWLALSLSRDEINQIEDGVIRTIGGVKYLYVVGSFTVLGGVSINLVGRFNFSTREWEEVGGGIVGINVHCIAFDSSDNAYVGGDFQDAGGVAGADFIAKLTVGASTWTSVGNGINGIVHSIRFNAAAVMHAVGSFINAGGDANADYVAKLSGGNWVAVAGTINSLVEDIGFDSSDVPHIVGRFTNAGGDANADYVAKLSGGAWVNVGGPAPNWCNCILFDLVGDLYIGGLTFGIRKLASGAWADVGSGLNSHVVDMILGADGRPIVAGRFTAAGQDQVDRIAIWDGFDFISPSASGGIGDGTVMRLVLDPDTGSVIALGSFTTAGSIVCKGIAILVNPLSDAIDSIASLFELYGNGYDNGWTPDKATWTYASSSTFTIYGDRTSTTHRVGRRVKFWDGGTTRMGEIIASSFSAATYKTTVTVNFTVPNTALSLCFHSSSLYPSGYVENDNDYFNFIPLIVGNPTPGLGTYSVQSGYCKTLESLAWISIALTWSAHTGTTTMRVSGLPFVALVDTPLAVDWNNITLAAVGNKITALVLAGTQEILLREIGGGAAANLPMDTAGVLRLSGWYLR